MGMGCLLGGLLPRLRDAAVCTLQVSGDRQSLLLLLLELLLLLRPRDNFGTLLRTPYTLPCTSRA